MIFENRDTYYKCKWQNSKLCIYEKNMARFGSDKWVNILKKISIDKNIGIFKQLHHMQVDHRNNKFKTRSQLNIFILI